MISIMKRQLNEAVTIYIRKVRIGFNVDIELMRINSRRE
jgi:hypothetical protein